MSSFLTALRALRSMRAFYWKPGFSYAAGREVGATWPQQVAAKLDDALQTGLVAGDDVGQRGDVGQLLR